MKRLILGCLLNTTIFIASEIPFYKTITQADLDQIASIEERHSPDFLKFAITLTDGTRVNHTENRIGENAGLAHCCISNKPPQSQHETSVDFWDKAITLKLNQVKVK